MSPGLTADVSAHIGVFIATLLIAIGAVGTVTVLVSMWVVRRWERNIKESDE